MPEYIEREAYRKELLVGQEYLDEDTLLTAINILDCAPAADVAPVVRCKDCKVPHNRWTGCSKLNGLIPPPDFYCAYGKRKDGERW